VVTKAGFIGLGNMGGEQARLIAKSDAELAVFDSYAPALEAFAGLARIATSPADTARGADLVHVCVRDDAQVEEVLFGDQGVAQTLAAGALVAVHSTIRIETLKSLSVRLQDQGIALIDAPVSRTRLGEEGRFVFTMMGGDPADAERARPVFESFSTDIMHVGALGSAMALKITNNLVSWVELMVGCQAQRIAEHFEVPYEKLRTVMKANGNLTPGMETLLDTHHEFAKGDKPEYDEFMASQAGIGEKDLALAIECGTTVGLEMNMVRGAQTLIRPSFERT
jgi:3-hydroxyisobutyrate dehydrogenase